MLSKFLSHARGNIVAYLALFLALGGTAVAARPLLTGADVQDGSLTGADIQNDSLTGSNVLESSLSNLSIAASDITGTVTDAQVSDTLTASSAANADKLDGKDSADYIQKTELLWALVDRQGVLVDGHGATAATKIVDTFGFPVDGKFRVTFNRPVNTCVTTGSATDVNGGAVPSGASNRTIATDNRVVGDNNTVDVATTNPTGTDTDPIVGDGFTVVVYC
jgi:hypothetical protein